MEKHEELLEKIHIKCQELAREFSELYDDEAPLHERLLTNFARYLFAHHINSLPPKETCETCIDKGKCKTQKMGDAIREKRGHRHDLPVLFGCNQYRRVEVENG